MNQEGKEIQETQGGEGGGGDNNQAYSSPAKSNYSPHTMERSLQCLQFNQSGHLLLGASNLTGRYWIGSLWYYEEPRFAPSVEKSLTGVDCDHGLGDAIFIRCPKNQGKHVLVALDNGSMDHVALSRSQEEEGKQAFHYLDRLSTVTEHDDLITAIKQTSDDGTFLSASYDRSIVALDSATLALKHRYSKAHFDLIFDLDCSQSQPELFVTAGQDGLVAGWDLRTQTSRQTLINATDGAVPTCAQYYRGDENYVVVGDVAGSIRMVDARVPGTVVASVEESFNKQIHKIVFSPNDKNKFSACADECGVRVLEVGDGGAKITMTYEDHRHTDFVRGLAWNPKDGNLWSCGWDKKVIEHKI